MFHIPVSEAIPVADKIHEVLSRSQISSLLENSVGAPYIQHHLQSQVPIPAALRREKNVPYG